MHGHEIFYIYRYYATHTDSWTCISCELPNFSGYFFDTDSAPSLSSNPFSILSTPNCSPTFDSMSPQKHPPPTTCSTPNARPSQASKPTKLNFTQPKDHLIVFNTNFHSLWPRRAELSNLASEHNTDIIIGTETWLLSGVENSELLLDDYDIFRRNRDGRGGGGPYSHKEKSKQQGNLKINNIRSYFLLS